MKKPNIAKWLDGFNLAGKGILMATKERKFWIGFLISFAFFGTLMNLLSGGFSKFSLMGESFGTAMEILRDAFLAIFGVNQIFFDWLPIFSITVLQSILIGLIVLLWQKKRGQNSANVEKAGIVAGLIALGAGCPTCGTTLLTPLLGTLFSTSGLAMTGAISTAVTVIAIIVAVLAMKRLGEVTYVIIVNERYLKKKEARESGKNN